MSINPRLFSALALLLAACTTEVELPDDAPEAEAEPRLYGDVDYASDCTAQHMTLLEESMELGRIVSNTDTFRECVTDRITQQYIPCNGDPYYSAPLEEQIDRALAATRFTNDVHMTCTGSTLGNASAAIGSYGHNEAEGFVWGEWLTAVLGGGEFPICGPGETPDWGPNSCRPAGWPWSQVAGIAWHEVSHTHGYTHDYCGITDPGYNFQADSIPYIVGNCLGQTIQDSAEACGENAACGWVSFEVLEDGQCECRRDPVPGWSDRAFNGHDRWYPGDFDGDGTTDVIRALNQYGGAEVLLSDGEFFDSDGIWSGAGFWSHRWYVGNFDGQGGDDIMRLSHQYGGAQVFLSNGSGFDYAGTWTGAGIYGHRWYVGDFDGNGVDDVMRLSHQYGGAEVFLSNGSDAFESQGVWTGAGIWGDQWYVGNFDGQGGDDIMRLSHQYGGGQVFLSNGSDAFEGGATWTGAGYWGDRWYVGDFDDDGMDDIVRRSHQYGGAEVFASTGNAFVSQGEWTGAGLHGNHWYVGNFDGQGPDDLLRLHDAAGGAEVFKSNGVDEFER